MGFRRFRILGTAALAAVVAAAPAGAVHWPNAGGDAGRSGAQPVEEGGLPIAFLYSRTGVSERDVRTSMITTGGDRSVQRLAYGTDDGFVHLRVLVTGAPVGPPAGTDLSAAADPFGGGSGSVSFVSSSTDGALGQLYSVHNEVYEGGTFGLQLAQVDEATGDVVRQVDLAGTVGYRIQSSPLLTPPDGAGNRNLFFVAEERDGVNQRLFRVPLFGAADRGATIGGAVATPDVNANPGASPTLVFLNDSAGRPTAYVAVATFDGIATFAVADLAPGPADDTVGEAVRTPSTPVTPSGEAPGAPGSGVAVAPAIYAASSLTGSSAVATLHKFTQTGNSQTLTRVSSGRLAGEAAPGIAISTDGRRVVVATARNLYALAAGDLAVVAKLSPGDDLTAGGTGFTRTIPVTTGDLVFAVSDGGGQLALDGRTLQPVDRDLFLPARASEGSTFAIGQPSISRRTLQLSTDRGIFVYGLRRASPPTGYWLAASDGGIFTYGDAGFFGSTGDLTLNKPIVTMAPTPAREGYWLTASDGGIFTFGDAGFFGSTGDVALNAPIVGMVPTRSGLGYWLVATDGGVFTFGDAVFHGSTGDLALNRPIVGMATTPAGDGYWLVASDGGIFAFGDAAFLGSTGDIVLNKPIVGMAPLPNGNGYWMVASDGGVFSFGRAGFFGSTGDITLNSPIVAITPSATGLGYLFTAADGGVFAFGDAPFLGSAAELGPLNRPVTTIAARP